MRLHIHIITELSYSKDLDQGGGVCLMGVFCYSILNKLWPDYNKTHMIIISFNAIRHVK